MAGRQLAQIMARINPTGGTVALVFDLADTKLRNCYLGSAHVDGDIALFDRLLREAFETPGGAVFRIDGDVWLALTNADEPETLVVDLAGSYVEMTPFIWDWTFTACNLNGDEMAANVTGNGLFERAFRCGMVRLVPGKEVAEQVEGIQERLFASLLNTPTWLDSPDTKPVRSNDARVEWLSISDLRCPFCEMTILHDGFPGCVDTACAGCKAHIEADFQFA